METLPARADRVDRVNTLDATVKQRKKWTVTIITCLTIKTHSKICLAKLSLYEQPVNYYIMHMHLCVCMVYVRVNVCMCIGVHIGMARPKITPFSTPLQLIYV